MKRSILPLAAFVAIGINFSATADPITHTITESNVDWTSAGVAGVGDGSGDITVGGITGTVDKAFLYWHGIDNGADGNYDNADVTINGNPVTGVAIGTATTNCWGNGNSVAYRADVSSHVNGDGIYSIAGLSAGDGHNANGASLVVTFDDGNPANDRDLAFFEGNDSNNPAGFPGEDEGWHAVLTGIDYGGGTVNAQFHMADGQSFVDNSLTLATVHGAHVIADAVGLWDGVSLPTAGTSRAGNGELFDIHTFDITPAFGGVTGSVDLNLDGQDHVSDCLGLVLGLIDLEPGSAPPPPGSEDFSKSIVEGPDVDGDGEIDAVIALKQAVTTQYIWEINYVGSEDYDVLITDRAPAESVVTAINGNGDGLPLDCGESTDFNSGEILLSRGGKAGKNCRSDTGIEWAPESNSAKLEVSIEMRESPGKGHQETTFAPTSCGALYLNKGAVATLFDPDTGELATNPDTGELLEPLTSNQLCIAAVRDPLAFGFDADNDGDGIADHAEACTNDVRTDPCLADTDGDGVNDNEDSCPVDANVGDTDNDGIDDACDPDDDNDGIPDADDACPLDPTNSCPT